MPTINLSKKSVLTRGGGQNVGSGCGRFAEKHTQISCLYRELAFSWSIGKMNWLWYLLSFELSRNCEKDELVMISHVLKDSMKYWKNGLIMISHLLRGFMKPGYDISSLESFREIVKRWTDYNASSLESFRELMKRWTDYDISSFVSFHEIVKRWVDYDISSFESFSEVVKKKSWLCHPIY